jgi:gliding motility associated protien GldN
MNQPFYYPVIEHLNWKSFITVVLDAVKTGELTAYDAEIDDEFTTPMSITDVEALLNGVAVQQEQKDLDGNVIGTTTAYEDRFAKTEVKSIRLKEVWYFDKQRSQLQVRILGFCPVWEYTTTDGQFKRRPLFWIYYPESRQVLARAEVFNRKNGAERRTYDDIFWKRMFSSYVYKEDNVYDRKIADYASGMDALLESERIKTEVFEIEQFMWDY